MLPFSRPTLHWFQEHFAEPTPVQAKGWDSIARGQHALLAAPTGSGKTLAAFLWGIDRASSLEMDAPPGVRILYVSPLKALAYDVERNLRAPLAGIQLSRPPGHRTLRVDTRTGDTPAAERREQQRNPGELLVTTPESLFLLLGSKARETLRTVHTVIIDEVHALAPTKRGVHLALSLERLSHLADVEPQRIGLSATAHPLEEIAGFLAGDRPCDIVHTPVPPRLDLEVRVPHSTMSEDEPHVTGDPNETSSLLGELYRRDVGVPSRDRGLWSSLQPLLLREIQSHRSTIVFVNSRTVCERLARQLNEMAEEELVLAHHGSVSHAKRQQMEEALKAGSLRGIVATSSLELGIDMGAVDLVLQLDSPGSVSRGLQRIGRAGHQVGATSVGRIYPRNPGDLLESAVVAERMLGGHIESQRVPRRCLDVLAQQIIAWCCDEPMSPDTIASRVMRAAPYRRLTRDALDSVLDMLTGRFPDHELADLKPRLRWDRERDELSARPGTAMVCRLNGGTIPDRGMFPVHLGEGGPRVGELDEEMVFEIRQGEVFLLGASSWRVEEITKQKVVVSPAPGEPGRMPFWRGEGPGRPLELGLAIGKLLRDVLPLNDSQTASHLRRTLPIDDLAASNLARYLSEQKTHTGTLPTDGGITVETFRDELGDWRVCILSPLGSRIHAPWAMAIQQQVGNALHVELQTTWTDDGIVLRLADGADLPALDHLFPDPDDLESLISEHVGTSPMFASLFRENAARSLLLTRRHPRNRSPLWAQRLRAQSLMEVVQRHPRFPVVLETYRQVMSDVFDLPGVTDVLRRIRARELRVDEVETRTASPFARSLVYAFTSAYLREGDSPAAERRAQALTLDRDMLRDLLGHADLREMLDASVVAQAEEELQALATERHAKHADGLHDLLRRLGDLSPDELQERAVGVVTPWLNELATQRRAAPVRIGGTERWIAAQDAGLYRDALGTVPPIGLAHADLSPVDDALAVLVRRYARWRGPFTVREVAVRFGLDLAATAGLLARLEEDGTLVSGGFRPGGTGEEWCHSDVLSLLKRRSLAHLRREVAAVDSATFGRFLPAWHGIGSSLKGPDRLDEVLDQLEGLALPWSLLSQVVLPSRVPGFHLSALDALSATGEVVWVGAGALGPRDGKVQLYRREHVATLWSPPETDHETGEGHDEAPPMHSPLHTSLQEHLETRGASFLTELERVARQAVPDATTDVIEAALWDLVWAGRITNDTFHPLRHLAGGRAKGRHRRTRGLAGGRWSNVRDLAHHTPTNTERSLALARVLLDRYGVVSRQVAAVEDLPGGFRTLYRVLREMEDAGRVKRGHFVEGLLGAQFAHAGAIDRLRALRPDGDVDGAPIVTTLAANDPAQVYGGLLPWPEAAEGGGRLRRAAGSCVFLVDGRVVLYASTGGKQLTTFPGQRRDEKELDAAFRALALRPRSGLGRLRTVETLDGVAAPESPLAERLRAAGFERDHRGLVPVPLSTSDTHARG